MRYYEAREFDLSKNVETGHLMLFLTEDVDAAAKSCVYTLNLAGAGWSVGPSRLKRVRTVIHKTGDLAWSVRPEHR